MASIRLLIFLLLGSSAYSLPIFLQQPLQYADADAECHPIDTFTPKWFLQNTRPEFRREIHGKALFYTKGASKYARELTCGSKEYVSLWQIWRPWLYNDKNTPDNKLRCIHNNRTETKTFYENMSEAYARMARKHATVMHMSSDFTSPPQDGIWGRVELPTLRLQTDITEMIKTNEDNSLYMKWMLPNKGARAVADLGMEEVQRWFRSVRDAWSPANDESVDACTLWASKEDGYLDSLW